LDIQKFLLPLCSENGNTTSIKKIKLKTFGNTEFFITFAKNLNNNIIN